MFSQTPVLHYVEEKTTDIARQQLLGGRALRRYCPGSTAKEWSSTESLAWTTWARILENLQIYLRWRRVLVSCTAQLRSIFG